jgi:hypothetical protein
VRWCGRRPGGVPRRGRSARGPAPAARGADRSTVTASVSSSIPRAPPSATPGLDTGYLTTLPGTRGSLYYDPATANLAVVAADEANKDTVTGPELAGATSILGEPLLRSPTP